MAAEDQQFKEEPAPGEDQFNTSPLTPTSGVSLGSGGMPGGALPGGRRTSSSSAALSSTAVSPRRHGSVQSPAGRSAHPDEATSEYFVGSMNREEAAVSFGVHVVGRGIKVVTCILCLPLVTRLQELLKDCPHGTYLIRRSDRAGNPYSLSLK